MLLAAAVLAGQASVGWSNDWLDARIDRLAARATKPVASGRLSAQAAGRAAGVALLGAVGLSFALGARPGAVHLVALLAAWSYNARLKSTRLSWAPYLLAFSAVPVLFVALSLPGSPLPAWQFPLGAGLLGLAGHFANTVPDTAADELTGVRGLPQRLGPRRAIEASAALVAAGAALLAWGAHWPAFMVAAAVVAVAVAAGSALLVGLGRRREPTFRLALGAAGVVVVGFVLSGAPHLLGR